MPVNEFGVGMFLSIQNQAPDDLREEVRKKGSVLTIRAFVLALKGHTPKDGCTDFSSSLKRPVC